MNGCRVITLLLLLAYSLLLVMAISGCAAEEETTPKLEPEAVTVEPEPEPKKDAEIKTEPNEGRNYLIKLQDHLDRFIKKFEQFVAQLATPEETDEWLNETLDILEVLKEKVVDARSLDPPEGFEELHEVYMKFIDTSDEAFDYYTKGLSEIDTDLLVKGNQKIEEATPYLEQVAGMLLDDGLVESLD